MPSDDYSCPMLYTIEITIVVQNDFCSEKFISMRFGRLSLRSCAFFKFWCAQFCGFSTSISGVALPKMTTLLRDKLPKCIEMNFSLQKSCWISLCITLDNYSHHWASLDIMTCVQAMMVQAQVRNPDLRARKCAFDTRALAQCFLQ